MSLSISAASTLYVGPSNDLDFRPLSGNVSGLGTSQCESCVTLSALAANQTVCISLQLPYPPGLLYFSTVGASDQITILTPEGTPVSYQNSTPGLGAKGGYIQGAAAGFYNIFFTSGTAYAAAAVVYYLQVVVEDTVTQFIDTGRTMFPNVRMGEDEPSINMIVSGNTNSAIPNALQIYFKNYKLHPGQNILLALHCLKNFNAFWAFNSSSITMIGQNYTTIFGTAGQQLAIPYASQAETTITGYFLLVIQQAGTTTFPPTVTVTPPPSMFNNLVSNTPNVSMVSNEVDVGIIESKMNGLEEMIKSLMSKFISEDFQAKKVVRPKTTTEMANKIDELISDFKSFRSENADAHNVQNSRLNAIMNMVGECEEE